MKVNTLFNFTFSDSFFSNPFQSDYIILESITRNLFFFFFFKLEK